MYLPQATPELSVMCKKENKVERERKKEIRIENERNIMK